MSVKEKSGQSTSRKQSTACFETPHRMKSLSRVSPDVRISRSTFGTRGARKDFTQESPKTPDV
jgi:hypothetical protein